MDLSSPSYRGFESRLYAYCIQQVGLKIAINGKTSHVYHAVIGSFPKSYLSHENKIQTGFVS